MAREAKGLLVAALLAWAAAAAGAEPPMMPAATAGVVAAVRAAARPVTGGPGDYDGLLAAIGDARIVLLGEATHGSTEFYRERARITRRLIEEKGFRAVVLEAAWEPARRLDAYVGGQGRDAHAAAALDGFVYFPRWMWRNAEVRDFVEDLRRRNDARPGDPVRLYGMDLYSVAQSADAVVRHLARSSVDAAVLARRRYACFDDYRPEPLFYGRDVEAGRAPSCAAGAEAQLAAMVEMAAPTGDEEAFAAWQSARVVRNGEDYYRTLYRADGKVWNLREQHMADTLSQLHERLGPGGRMVVWAQNIHQGDARHTDQIEVGELSLGQLMRERHGAAAFLVALTTYEGRVRAAEEWGGRDREWRLRPAQADSWSAVLHRAGLPAFVLTFDPDSAVAVALADRRLERAVGVTYAPKTERRDHYFHMRLSRQFDALIHIDRTTAVAPLP